MRREKSVGESDGGDVGVRLKERRKEKGLKERKEK